MPRYNKDERELMKKFLAGSIIFIVAISSGFAEVATDNSDTAYYISPKNNSAEKNFVMPATNITVINYSDVSIYILVPGIDYEVDPGVSNTINRDAYYGETSLVLQSLNGDWMRVNLFSNQICRHAIVTVDGKSGSYHTTVDKKYCQQ